MFTLNMESWIFIAVACLAGFVIGRWIKAQRKKALKKDEYLDGLKRMVLAEAPGQTKKEKKRNRRANKKNG